jgi:hypothetical protein
VIAKTSFVGASHIVVLHAKAEVVDQIPFIVLGDDLHLHYAAGCDEDLAESVGQAEDAGCVVKVSVCGFEHRRERVQQFC